MGYLACHLMSDKGCVGKGDVRARLAHLYHLMSASVSVGSDCTRSLGNVMLCVSNSSEVIAVSRVGLVPI